MVVVAVVVVERNKCGTVTISIPITADITTSTSITSATTSMAAQYKVKDCSELVAKIEDHHRRHYYLCLVV